jgi:hypothetical protein
VLVPHLAVIVAAEQADHRDGDRSLTEVDRMDGHGKVELV